MHHQISSPGPQFPTLEEDISVDVAIVGAGITGLTCASLLSSRGLKVAVLEAKHVGSGTTGHSTGNLYATLDSGLRDISSRYDVETSRMVAECRTKAMDMIEQLKDKFAIDCDFIRAPWHLLCESEDQVDTIKKEYAAAAAAGLSCSLLDHLELPFGVAAAMSIDNQAQFNALTYVQGLASAIHAPNCSIYENSRLLDFTVEDRCRIETPQAKVDATHLVLATHTPKGIHALQTAVFPYRENAIAVELKSDYPPPGIFWDLGETQHYSFRTAGHDNDRYLIVVGEPYKTGQGKDTNARFDELEAFARERFDVAKIKHRWAAQSYWSADGLPYIGELKERIYSGTGYASDGLTYGTLAGTIIAGAITGVENQWAKLFDIKRHRPLIAAKEYLKENINVAGELAKSFPGIADVDSPEEIAPGSGAVLSVKGEKLAVYRDEDSSFHAVSAICTHMKCTVNWNDAEKSWDCPCHGSRFALNGDVLEGPAMENLAPKPLPSED